MLSRWGRVVHRVRWWIVALAVLPLTPWLWVSPASHLDESVVPPGMESVRAVRLLDEELAPRPPAFGLIFSHPTPPSPPFATPSTARSRRCGTTRA
jgi:hypothetical protein